MRRKLSRIFLKNWRFLVRTRTGFTPDFRLVSPGFRRISKPLLQIVFIPREDHHLPGASSRPTFSLVSYRVTLRVDDVGRFPDGLISPGTGV
jgi:hypothetical protein